MSDTPDAVIHQVAKKSWKMFDIEKKNYSPVPAIACTAVSSPIGGMSGKSSVASRPSDAMRSVTEKTPTQQPTPYPIVGSQQVRIRTPSSGVTKPPSPAPRKSISPAKKPGTKPDREPYSNHQARDDHRVVNKFQEARDPLVYRSREAHSHGAQGSSWNHQQDSQKPRRDPSYRSNHRQYRSQNAYPYGSKPGEAEDAYPFSLSSEGNGASGREVEENPSRSTASAAKTSMPNTNTMEVTFVFPLYQGLVGFLRFCFGNIV